MSIEVLGCNLGFRACSLVFGVQGLGHGGGMLS